MPRRLFLLVLLLVGSATPAWAQIPVTDGGAAAQRILMLGNQALQYARQGQQIINEYNQIRLAITQIEHMVTNLKRMPAGLNLFDTMATYSARVQGIMAQATTLSFALDKITSDFTDLYGQASTTLTPAGLAALRKKWHAATLQTSQVAMQTQAIKSNLSDMYTRIQALLNGSWTAPGALHAQQVQSQQQALLQHTQEEMKAMMAANARLMAMDAAEKATLKATALAAYERATALAPVGNWQAGPVVDMVVPEERVRRPGN